MTIILYAGNAQDFCSQALNQAEKGNFTDCDELLAKAKEEIVKAHRIQTKIIQDAINKNSDETTVLFVHAQDTMMSANSEFKLTKYLIRIYKKIERIGK